MMVMNSIYVYIFKDTEGKEHELKITNTVRSPIPSVLWAVYIDNFIFSRLTTKRVLEFVHYLRNQTIVTTVPANFFHTRKVLNPKGQKIIMFEMPGKEAPLVDLAENFKDAFSDILMDAALGLLQNDLQRKHDL